MENNNSSIISNNQEEAQQSNTTIHEVLPGRVAEISLNQESGVVTMSSPQGTQVPNRAITQQTLDIIRQMGEGQEARDYENAYTKFNKDLIPLCKDFLRGYYGMDDISKKSTMRLWLDKVCEIYGIDHLSGFEVVADLQISGRSLTGQPEYHPVCGVYNRQEKTIKINKLSWITLYHEFKHHLDCCKKGKTGEHSARGWSISLYKLVAPKAFAKAKAEGKIGFIGSNPNANSQSELNPNLEVQPEEDLVEVESSVE